MGLSPFFLGGVLSVELPCLGSFKCFFEMLFFPLAAFLLRIKDPRECGGVEAHRLPARMDRLLQRVQHPLPRWDEFPFWENAVDHPVPPLLASSIRFPALYYAIVASFPLFFM